jgi:hypothetical protein
MEKEMKTGLLKARLLKMKVGLKRLGAAGTLADVLSLLGLDSVAQYAKAVAMVALLLLAMVEVMLAMLAKLLKTVGKLLLRYAFKLLLGSAASLLCFSVVHSVQFDINPLESTKS